MIERFSYELTTVRLEDGDYGEVYAIYDRLQGQTRGKQIAECKDVTSAEQVVKALNTCHSYISQAH